MNRKTYPFIFSALGIAINIVLGSITSMLSIPFLFLDTLGTIFTAVIFGPFYGAFTGGLTNVVQGILTNPKDIPFALVNIAVGLLVGFIAKKKTFHFSTALITGILLAVLCPLIGTPISIYLYGGITGDFNDIFFSWLVQSGQGIFTAAFIPRITSNLIDKIVSTLIVSFLLDRLPKNMTEGKAI
ncbi:CD3073 family putative ECF transporter S component [Garciella nitratireducens]|uniref:CD3073 family putative ECF transporter S component n=1 Tax=Garciella nitratireducens TaxID=218205 RepID=UPI000DE9EC0F|nr:CD3073 family putative ECF transporter S component [Garciella nitratireducens]RBP36560.1 energy-coupling factor transport system substrate-specific component [Garciella nitratireducens]